ncbi:MAG: NAD(P)-dependent oxidoreductase [Pseudomonadota bacterium]
MTMTLLKRAEVKRRRHPKRIGSLACLPLFFSLEGRKVVVIGGTEPAAWKAELLAASGAEVHVFALELSSSFEKLIAAGSIKGRFIHIAKEWEQDCFDNACLVIADAIDEREACAIRKAARAAGVPVNVIDNPAHCDFQFGSIVNRSPVVIGISTNGVAPILGQAIRRRIETLLPRSLERWAEFAGGIRNNVMESLRPGQERRQFWEKYSDRALSGEMAPTTEMEAFSSSLISKAKASQSGHVTLVGTGSGDADLLTLKAVRALQSADIILFDRQVSDEILELARREAQRIPVETAECQSTCSQKNASKRLFSEAQQGKHVVWVKAGHPAIERESLGQLERSGIVVTVVPGVVNEQEHLKEAGLQTGSGARILDAEVLHSDGSWWTDGRTKPTERHLQSTGHA